MRLVVKQALIFKVILFKKINTFVAIFPMQKPQYAGVLLEDPKPNKEYIYYYRDGDSHTKVIGVTLPDGPQLKLLAK